MTMDEKRRGKKLEWNMWLLSGDRNISLSKNIRQKHTKTVANIDTSTDH
jgi:hypothetical protein